jgi:BA14K-like protein
VYSANRLGSETAPVIADALDNTSPRRLTLKGASNEITFVRRLFVRPGRKPTVKEQVMRNKVSILAAAALIAMSIVPFTNNASATPIVGALALKNAAPTNVETVRWRGRRYYGPGWGVGAGLLGGAIIGGILAAPYYGNGAYAYEPGPYIYHRGYGGNAVAYCMRRFKSYDPGSRTYLGFDGYRHPCP